MTDHRYCLESVCDYKIEDNLGVLWIRFKFKTLVTFLLNDLIMRQWRCFSKTIILWYPKDQPLPVSSSISHSQIWLPVLYIINLAWGEKTCGLFFVLTLSSIHMCIISSIWHEFCLLHTRPF